MTTAEIQELTYLQAFCEMELAGRFSNPQLHLELRGALTPQALTASGCEGEPGALLHSHGSGSRPGDSPPLVA